MRLPPNQFMKATSKDIPEILELAKELGEETPLYFSRLIKEGIVLVEKDGKSIIGVVYGERNKKENWTFLCGIVVSEKFRNRGIGKRLLKEFENQAVGQIELFADVNTLAKFIEKFGYEKKGNYINFCKRV